MFNRFHQAKSNQCADQHVLTVRDVQETLNLADQRESGSRNRQDAAGYQAKENELHKINALIT